MDIDANYVRWRLDEAGSVFLALSGVTADQMLGQTQYSALAWSMALVKWEFRTPVHEAPNETAVNRMRAAYSWPMLAALQASTDMERQALTTRLLFAKSLTRPDTDRRLIGWRTLKRALDLPRGTMRVLHEDALEHCAAYVRKTMRDG